METQEAPDNQNNFNRMNYAGSIFIHDTES